MWDRGETVKRNNSAALGQGPGSPPTDTHNNIFELFCRYWNPLQVGRVNNYWWYASHKHVDPRPVGTWRLMMLTSTYLTTNQPIRRMSTSWSHLITIKLLTTLSKLGHMGFEGISPLWPPLPGKAIKLFFSTSPKTLWDLTQCQGTEAGFGFSIYLSVYLSIYLSI